MMNTSITIKKDTQPSCSQIASRMTSIPATVFFPFVTNRARCIVCVKVVPILNLDVLFLSIFFLVKTAQALVGVQECIAGSMINTVHVRPLLCPFAGPDFSDFILGKDIQAGTPYSVYAPNWKVSLWPVQCKKNHQPP